MGGGWGGGAKGVKRWAKGVDSGEGGSEEGVRRCSRGGGEWGVNGT